MKQSDYSKPLAKKGRWQNRPLKVRLAGYFILFAFILLVFLWLFQIVFLDDFYRLIKTEQIKQTTHAVVQRIDDESLSEYIDHLYTKYDVSVSVFDTSSDMFVRVYDTHRYQGLGVDIMPHEVYAYYQTAKQTGKQVLADKESSQLEGLFPDKHMPEDDFFVSNMLACAQITHNSQGDEFLVVQKIRITPVTSTVETLRVQLVIITAILVVFSVGFAVVVSQKFSKPLAETNEGAKELAKRNYNVTFDSGGYKEICELCETLNIAAAELSTVDRLRRELIANISHDLRTPLTMISGYAEVMRDIPGENSPENLQVIIDESRRLSSLVTDLLDLSKLEASSTAMNMDKFSITDCIRDIFTRYSKLSENEGYNMVFVPDRDVYVYGDEVRLSQVIYNLINNAVNYCGEDKTVIVNQIVSGKKVRIEVTDHGAGIPSEDLKYIWDRYYRVDKEHKSAVIGSGLGLSIAKNVLEYHKARFGVISQVGSGSTFWFELDTEDVDRE